MKHEQGQKLSFWREQRATALLVLANGMVLEGTGFGAEGSAVGEVCFNTAMTGYQEILTDPSYAGQIVTFTFPHIGNVGTNDEDVETSNLVASASVRGIIVHAPVTDPSNYRADGELNSWLKARGIVGLCGVDTRALTAFIRENGMPNAVIAHSPSGDFDVEALRAMARQWPGLEGMDLVPTVTAAQRYAWTQAAWRPGQGFRTAADGAYNVVAIDYGIKRNILRLLTEAGCAVTVVPAETSAEAILALRPDGVILSNGPGDPAETGKYAVPVIRELIARDVPTFGICLGHQMLALAIGAKTMKMHQGHHGANHPVQDFTTGKVEIVSMNHGFAVDTASLPANARETHRSLFDESNCGLELTDHPAFSVQHHPEASPGPRDSHYLFARFVRMMETSKLAVSKPDF
ncbi:MAG TPA: glutamine-hydrolyzing carbamoyl-phosphate synthase small subunit [Methylocella sp.]|nr:glutamine-hydrolyzing carbamoyl-phosphate synthase small subunit [Methylocella sp.]